MIEVNLFSINSVDPNTLVGRCVARSRFDLDTMGVSVMEYTKKFMRENLDTLESGLGNSDLVGLINSDMNMTVKDFYSINYLLSQVGYKITLWNVADDEENPLEVPDGDGVYEINIIDNCYLQNDLPTVTKVMSASGDSLVDTLENVINQIGLFKDDHFNGVDNPLEKLIRALKTERDISGSINATITTKLYQVLEQLGIKLFYAASEA